MADERVGFEPLRVNMIFRLAIGGIIQFVQGSISSSKRHASFSKCLVLSVKTAGPDRKSA
jgi:hypothetical protein